MQLFPVAQRFWQLFRNMLSSFPDYNHTSVIFCQCTWIQQCPSVFHADRDMHNVLAPLSALAAYFNVFLDSTVMVFARFLLAIDEPVGWELSNKLSSNILYSCHVLICSRPNILWKIFSCRHCSWGCENRIYTINRDTWSRGAQNLEAERPVGGAVDYIFSCLLVQSGYGPFSRDALIVQDMCVLSVRHFCLCAVVKRAPFYLQRENRCEIR